MHPLDHIRWGHPELAKRIAARIKHHATILQRAYRRGEISIGSRVPWPHKKFYPIGMTEDNDVHARARVEMVQHIYDRAGGLRIALVDMIHAADPFSRRLRPGGTRRGQNQA